MTGVGEGVWGCVRSGEKKRRLTNRNPLRGHKKNDNTPGINGGAYLIRHMCTHKREKT